MQKKCFDLIWLSRNDLNQMSERLALHNKGELKMNTYQIIGLSMMVFYPCLLLATSWKKIIGN
jgi:hypothetical protein